MENPFKAIELKTWPDFLLAISGVTFVTSIVAMYAGSVLAKNLSIFFFGLVMFGLGGKIAHYKFRDPNIIGNVNAWFSGWRHSILADTFAVSGIVLAVFAVFLAVKETV